MSIPEALKKFFPLDTFGIEEPPENYIFLGRVWLDASFSFCTYKLSNINSWHSHLQIPSHRRNFLKEYKAEWKDMYPHSEANYIYSVSSNFEHLAKDIRVAKEIVGHKNHYIPKNDLYFHVDEDENIVDVYIQDQQFKNVRELEQRMEKMSLDNPVSELPNINTYVPCVVRLNFGN
jgi:hypothetical protein